LRIFKYYGNPIQFIDNVAIERYEKFFGRFHVRDYTKIKKCQLVVIKWYHRRKRKSIIICNIVHDWIWKPVCGDGRFDVRLRLDTKDFGLNPG
jgi:hypothetical protein